VSVHVEPVTATVGATISGVDLREPLALEARDTIEKALLESGVLFFRDQDIKREQQLAFAAYWGPIEVHPFAEAASNFGGTSAEIQVLEKGDDAAGAENMWHSDVTWRAEPSLGSILRARVVPDVGGDTLFANMEAGYNALDEETRALIDDLWAIHDNEGLLNGMRLNGASEAEIEARRVEFPPQRHPVVRTHPVTGRKCIYVNRIFTSHIVGLEPEQSDALLRLLCEQAHVPEYQCRFRWQKGSVAFWDNRAVQHYAANDYWPQRRVMERATIIGERPV